MLKTKGTYTIKEAFHYDNLSRKVYQRAIVDENGHQRAISCDEHHKIGLYLKKLSAKDIDFILEEERLEKIHEMKSIVIWSIPFIASFALFYFSVFEEMWDPEYRKYFLYNLLFFFVLFFSVFVSTWLWKDYVKHLFIAVASVITISILLAIWLWGCGLWDFINGGIDLWWREYRWYINSVFLSPIFLVAASFLSELFFDD